MSSFLTLSEINRAAQKLKDKVVLTPSQIWTSPYIQNIIGAEAQVFLKLELMQFTGTFKARGALINIFSLSKQELKRGVTAVSAGNHAIATAFAAKIMGTNSKVVMVKNANPFRVQQCQSFNAEIVFADNIHHAFDIVKKIETQEGRTFIHPFEGHLTALGTATLGLEFANQVKNLDALIIPIGGGGLCAGVASAFKLIQPKCYIYGVEPEGADTMSRSFRSGVPEKIEQVRTIADSLGAPYAMPYSYSLCKRNVDEIVLVDDIELRKAMGVLFLHAKLAVEPAGAAATAALLGPLREKVKGQRVGVIICGANTDFKTFYEQALFKQK